MFQEFYNDIDFWSVFRRAKEVLENPKDETCSEAERTAFDNLFESFRLLDGGKLKQGLDTLKDKKENESVVWISENILSPLLGESGQCLLNLSHAIPLQHLQAEGKGKHLAVENLGIGKCNILFANVGYWTC